MSKREADVDALVRSKRQKGGDPREGTGRSCISELPADTDNEIKEDDDLTSELPVATDNEMEEDEDLTSTLQEVTGFSSFGHRQTKPRRKKVKGNHTSPLPNDTDHEIEEDEDLTSTLQGLMGFSSFSTTKDSKVKGNYTAVCARIDDPADWHQTLEVREKVSRLITDEKAGRIERRRGRANLIAMEWEKDMVRGFGQMRLDQKGKEKHREEKSKLANNSAVRIEDLKAVWGLPGGGSHDEKKK